MQKTNFIRAFDAEDSSIHIHLLCGRGALELMENDCLKAAADKDEAIG